MKKILFIIIGLSVGLMADFVRDGSTSIVTDTATGLQWQDDTTPISMTWQGAIDYCEALKLGGKSDWRLPNINELTSVVNVSVDSPSISNIFVNTVSDKYWSSTTLTQFTNNAFIVDFSFGYQSSNYAKTTSHYVRCVRAGQ